MAEGEVHNPGEERTTGRRLRALRPRTWATPGLVALLGAVFLIMVGRGAHPLAPAPATLVAWGASFGPLTTGGQGWRLLTATLLHVGAVHLLLNLVVLWDIGFMAERLVGAWGFLVAYLLAGVAGSLVSVALHPTLVCAGASGSIFGLFGLVLGVLHSGRAALPAPMAGRLRKGALGFIGCNVLFGLAVPGIDLAAHLGGLGAGFLCGLALAQPLTREGRALRGRAALTVAAVGGAMAASAWVILGKA
jgi:rhomboid protease GluP